MEKVQMDVFYSDQISQPFVYCLQAEGFDISPNHILLIPLDLTWLILEKINWQILKFMIF